MTVTSQAPCLWSFARATLGDKYSTPQGVGHGAEGLKLLVHSRPPESGRGGKEGAGEAGPGRGAADVQFSLASRAGLGDPLARWPGLLGTALPRALCLRHRGDDHRTARRPFTSPTSAASPPSSPRLPQGPLLGVEAPARLAGIGEN